MKFRKITSITLAFCFILEIITGTILFIVPPGRIAYWADWRFFGLSKTQWSEVHITISILFLFGSALHIYYNWNPLVNYLKDKKKARRVILALHIL